MAKSLNTKKDEKKETAVAKKTSGNNTDFDYTKKFTESAKKIEENVKKGKLESSGVKTVAGKAEVKQYPKKYVAGKAGQKDRVVDSKGKIVKEAKVLTKTGEKFNPQLRKEFVRDSTDYANRAKSNLNFVNVNTGAKTTLTGKDLKSLKDLKKIKIIS